MLAKRNAGLISRRVDRNHPDTSFDSSSLGFREKISMLGVTLGSNLSWNDHTILVAKAAACKLVFLFRTKRFFTPTQLLTLYKARIRSCLELLAFVERSLRYKRVHRRLQRLYLLVQLLLPSIS